MAGPCGCRDAGCGCCFIENPDSGVPYTVYGSGASGDCVKLDIKNIVTTIASNPDDTLTYTNETGATVTWFNGDHYSVDVRGELTGDTTVPNVVVVDPTDFGALNPLTVTIVNPSTTRSMSVHTQGTGEELLILSGQTATNSRWISIQCLYSLNGAPETGPKSGGGQYRVPIRSAEQRNYNGHTAAPCFVGTVPPGGSWFIRVTRRQYQLPAAFNAGSAAAQGQVITVSGSTTV